jgi:hypothetical protein
MAVSAALRLRWLAFVPVRLAGRCWLWSGCKDRDGYGAIADAGKTLGAHRVSYEMHHRPLPPGSVVMHSCDTPACVNPAHLSLGTKRTNAADMTSKGRRASKLTRVQALAIRARAAGESLGQLAAAFGVSESTVRSIVSGRSWR